MDASSARFARAPVFASNPSPHRPAVTTAVAAEHLGMSRYYVSELVRRGEIDGYGIRRNEGSRVRWFVYKDTLSGEPAGVSDSYGHSAELAHHLLDARGLARCEREARTRAEAIMTEAFDLMNEALNAMTNGDERRAFTLVLEAHAKRSAQDRQHAEATEFATQAEVCIDEALRSVLPSMDESVSTSPSSSPDHAAGASVLHMPDARISR